MSGHIRCFKSLIKLWGISKPCMLLWDPPSIERDLDIQCEMWLTCILLNQCCSVEWLYRLCTLTQACQGGSLTVFYWFKSKLLAYTPEILCNADINNTIVFYSSFHLNNIPFNILKKQTIPFQKLALGNRSMVKKILVCGKKTLPCILWRFSVLAKSEEVQMDALVWKMIVQF